MSHVHYNDFDRNITNTKEIHQIIIEVVDVILAKNIITDEMGTITSKWVPEPKTPKKNMKKHEKTTKK